METIITKLDIISDPICPWCAIGKANLDRALVNRPNHDFSIEWHPFQLNPDMPPEGMDRRAYLERKFGGRTGARGVYGQIEAAAAKAGVEVHFDRILRTPNTIDAHRLIYWAGLEGVQTTVVAMLFHAYLSAGRDISDREVLIDIARSAGIDPAMIARLLAEDADTDGIRKQDAHARQRGVDGVPFFIIGDLHVVKGAQPSTLWERVIDDIAENRNKQSA